MNSSSMQGMPGPGAMIGATIMAGPGAMIGNSICGLNMQNVQNQSQGLEVAQEQQKPARQPMEASPERPGGCPGTPEQYASYPYPKSETSSGGNKMNQMSDGGFNSFAANQQGNMMNQQGTTGGEMSFPNMMNQQGNMMNQQGMPEDPSPQNRANVMCVAVYPDGSQQAMSVQQMQHVQQMSGAFNMGGGQQF